MVLIEQTDAVDAVNDSPINGWVKDDLLGTLMSLPTTAIKTGHWVEVYGYCTPGGDPVWCCSECGKGIHVYGIEAPTYGRNIADHQWVACPNCGAMMKGEQL